MRWSLLLPSVVAGCALLGPSVRDTVASPAAAPTLPDLEIAPPESPRSTAVERVAELSSQIDQWFAGHGSRRLHVQLDRPLYRPGDAVWIKTWSVQTRGLQPSADPGVTYALVDPRGATVESKRVFQQNGGATNDFVLPADAPGGRWTLRATLDTGEVDERPFVVSSYEAPRLHKTLDFVREAYGPGDRVEALVELKAADGSPLAGRAVHTLIQVGGATVAEADATTDASGAVMVGGALPDALTADGLLTVLVDDGGVTESISRSIPIVLADLQLAFFPEGGDLVSDLPGRVYWQAKDRHGEPADAAFEVVDDQGVVVASTTSVHDGLGRFAFTPKAGRSYRARVTAPAGLAASFPLPEARRDGCVLRSYDDVRSETSRVRVGLRCTAREDVTVVGVLHEAPLDAAAVTVVPGRESVVYLSTPKDRAQEQGAVRVTAFDGERRPLAERLVYRNAGRDLRVELTPDRTEYGPRDPVTVAVRTTRPDGSPVAAELALAVVDDAVLGLADDEEGNLLTRTYLEPELGESPDDPAWYFDAEEPLAARGLDLVLGTMGWRRFEWAPVFAPPAPVLSSVVTVGNTAIEEGWIPEEMALPPMAMPAAIEAPVAELDLAEEPAWDAADGVAAQPVADGLWAAPPADAPAMREEKRAMDVKIPGFAGRAAGGKRKQAPNQVQAQLRDLGYVDWDDRVGGGRGYVGWAPVRVFPRPDHGTVFTGIRTDFRDTVHWEPTLRTGEDGRGTLSFVLSDAVTTFRVTAEGLGGGMAAHAEATLSSVLPVSLATKLPPAVSVGDELLLPVTLTNTRGQPLEVALSAVSSSGALTTVEPRARLSVAGRSGATRFVPFRVGSAKETVQLTVSAEGGGLADTVVRSVDVVPAGFPRSFSAAGELEGKAVHAFTLDEPVAHSLVARVEWHPSPTSTLVSGLEGLIGMPGGCFEQTSTTNWPNVAILKYLEAHDGDPRLRARSGAALEQGYRLLTGYQVSQGGFETFGSGPGKEALSAFGLLEFTDMAHVYPVKPAVFDQDVRYLLSARDGKGGFTNSGESSHGYGSAPKPVLDAFITWAMVATGHGDALGKEVAAQAAAARTTSDPYVLALATRTLLKTGHAGAPAAVERLRAMQAADGSFPGAESSITRSYESNLLVETTALATSALLEAKRYGEADEGARWLVEHRQGQGTWGATQATAQALEALTLHAELASRPRASGAVSVEVNGVPAGRVRYEADEARPLLLAGLERHLHPGDNTIVLRQEGGQALPYTVDVQWTAVNPTSAPGAELVLSTRLDRGAAKMGETVRLTARLENTTGAVVPSPIARIGLPAGLEAQLWQLKELQDRGVIAFYETRPREVTLYWEGQHADEVHEVNLDLLAAVPGTYTGPASSAWPYYDDDERSWAKGLRVAIAAP